MSFTDLTGHWIGGYLYWDEEHPMTADFVQTGERLSGSMQDDHTDREYSVFQAALERGLPPGAHEEIESKLRQMFPEARPGSIRYVWHLPAHSVVEGKRAGRRIYLLKTYPGVSFAGYKVGDHLFGTRIEGHAVRYEAQLSPDGLTIEGQYRIDGDTSPKSERSDGLFHLRRRESGMACGAEQVPELKAGEILHPTTSWLRDNDSEATTGSSWCSRLPCTARSG
ncbi:MAG TPA: hypothetical protein VGY66_16940 [Gemmataceae bacterium]|jgi:hypothetical protein|nr:hypothetical protein [Gemmataceae bacterium]